MKITKINTLLLLIFSISIMFSCSEEEINEKNTDSDTTQVGDSTDTTDTNDKFPPPTDHPIQIRTVDGEAEFYNTTTNETFIPVGVNYFYIVQVAGVGLEDRFFGLNNFDANRVKEDFELLKTKGYNVVRIFIDACSEGPECIGKYDGEGLNTAFLENIVTTMEIAKDIGIHLLLTSNDLPSQGGYWAMVDEAVGPNFGPYRNAHYLTEKGVAAGVKYWDDLMSGLVDLGAPFEVVFSWSLLNEQWYFRTDPPFSLSSGEVTTANGNTYDMAIASEKRDMATEGMVYYIDMMSETIRNYDPNSLISMGFFMPESTDPISGSGDRYVDTAPLLPQASLDFFDFHGYPNPSGGPSMETHAINYGMVGYTDKPIIMGEVGAFIDRYDNITSAIEGTQSWIVQSCEYGFDGWLYWGMYRAPVEIGDATWGFMDENKDIMEALAPINTPDLCDESFLPPENIALNKPATASNSLAENPPDHITDGDLETNWSSGGDAPQWIEIDLENTYAINRIKLVVDQYPAGTTNHNVLVKGSSGDYTEVHTFNGTTDYGDVLDHSFEPALNDVQFIKIETTSSPSWVAWIEIEVFGE